MRGEGVLAAIGSIALAFSVVYIVWAWLRDRSRDKEGWD